jgi:transposase-like protein
LPVIPRRGRATGGRGVEVDHVTVYRWVQRFTPLFVDAARVARHSPGDRWFVDETYVKVIGVWRYVYRAIDQRGRSSTCWSRRAGSMTWRDVSHQTS